MSNQWHSPEKSLPIVSAKLEVICKDGEYARSEALKGKYHKMLMGGYIFILDQAPIKHLGKVLQWRYV